MKEIGGYFEFELNHGKEFHSDAIALNTGRNCLRYLILSRQIKVMYLPELLCGSIEEVCQEEGVTVIHYPIGKQWIPLIDATTVGENYIYIINYYGQLHRDKQKELTKKFSHVIIDNAQAFYELPLPNIDTIYTCRKFFGVPDGAYLYSDCNLIPKLERDISYDRISFLMGREETSASTFFKEFQKNEMILQNKPLRYMSKGTQNLLRGIDYEAIKIQRNKNFEFLNKALYSINGLDVQKVTGAYMYPLHLTCGEELRLKLQQRKIYVPLLWPNVREHELARNLVPLPCDQRYTLKDMQHILDSIDGIIS